MENLKQMFFIGCRGIWLMMSDDAKMSLKVIG